MYVYHHHHHQGALMLQITWSLSLAVRHYHPSLLVSPLNSIQCPHRADECKFLRVGQ